MHKKELAKRYLVFLVGLVFNAFGVAFVTDAALGTSPIAAIPYTLSLIVPNLSMGTWVILFNLALVLIQFAIEGKSAHKLQLLLEAGVTVLFGYGIDLSRFCLQAFRPDFYPLQLVSLLVGCCIIACGAYLEVVANVVMLAGDAFVNAIAKRIHRSYGGVRMVSDISMTVIAGALCLLFLHELSGVREGTILSALLVGNLVKVLGKVSPHFGERLFGTC